MVYSVEKSQYLELLTVWEASVRATHDFLPESHIQKLKPLILEFYFDAVSLHCCKDSEGCILGFSGVAEGNLEMLFISPTAMGLGLGRELLQHAIDKQDVTKVDVNEQNPKATAFYQHMGFKVIDRSELDGQGEPFPLLHMRFPSS